MMLFDRVTVLIDKAPDGSYSISVDAIESDCAHRCTTKPNAFPTFKRFWEAYVFCVGVIHYFYWDEATFLGSHDWEIMQQIYELEEASTDKPQKEKAAATANSNRPRTKTSTQKSLKV